MNYVTCQTVFIGYNVLMKEITKIQKEPVFVGDNLALDFINSEYGVGAAYQDYFTDDDAVLRWLKLAKVAPSDVKSAPADLMQLAIKLRDNAKALVHAAKFGGGADSCVVNYVLKEGFTAAELTWDSASRSFKAVSLRQYDNAAHLLEPIANALVTLLTETSIELVRQCEAHDCTLMFHDKTKSHRRRWCSMALCGNRMKVAAFRSRKQEE